MTFEEFFDKLQMRYGLESFGIFYGVYRAKVVSNADPEGRCRIKVRIPSAGQQQEGPDVWVDPATPGLFRAPLEGDDVFVAVSSGDPGRPLCYFGSWFTFSTRPDEFAPGDAPAYTPHRTGIKTRAGHSLLFDDTPGAGRVRITMNIPSEDDAFYSDTKTRAAPGEQSVLTMESDGTLIAATRKGSRVELNAAEEGDFVMVADSRGNSVSLDDDGIKVADSDGNVIEISNGKITISASSEVAITAPTCNVKTGSVFLGANALESLVKGESFQALYNTHQHPSPVGLTGPPLQPMTKAQLSSNNKTS